MLAGWRPSRWFWNPNRFPRSQTIQHIRTEIDSIGPDDSPRFGVDPDLIGEFDVLQPTEAPPRAGNPYFQVNLARGPVSEIQLQAVLSDVPDFPYAWKHTGVRRTNFCGRVAKPSGSNSCGRRWGSEADAPGLGGEYQLPSIRGHYEWIDCGWI